MMDSFISNRVLKLTNWNSITWPGHHHPRSGEKPTKRSGFKAIYYPLDLSWRRHIPGAGPCSA